MRSYVLCSLASTLSLCALAGCAGDGDSTTTTAAAKTEGLVVINEPVTPVATTEPTASAPTAASTLSATSVSTTNAFATFDFANGTSLPAKATLSLGSAVFRPGASVANVPVTLDRPTPNTVIARVTTVNGSGTTKAVAGTNYRTVDTVVVFRPGDPLRQTISVPIVSATAGQQFAVKLREAPWGANQGTSWVSVTASSSAVATASATTGFRAPRTFKATGTLQYEMSRAKMWWTDTGHDDAWSTQLPNGRAQPANGETGLYLDGWVYRDKDIEAPLRYTWNGLVMHTQKLKSPISYNGKSYYYGSVVLSGHNTPSTQIGYGQYEWVAKMPSRRGAWPAFWLISTSGWPPEIDVFEGFGYESYWDFDRYIASTIHGGANAVRTFQRGSVIQAEAAYGLSGFSQGFHSYAVDIQPDYITWFVDGVETYQSVNPFKGFRWYPIMDVAVKTTSAYDDGSGDMVVKGFRAWSSS
ncbi:family 16 glycosylhydrolase [Sphingomonas cannabina]|uniref:family 16 glycosylhydrolase n=1 Tax=Sphingomonas cannabina TaxID=2899123 RepID=UPI001F2C1B56|nr:family 16 glycosylhydrolase [Sphingomonas cannabina]UIJ46156.1 family 16 glycosylhydrolase [Sphingomonas cannabina]